MLFNFKVWQWVLLSIVAYLFFIIAYIPASLVSDLVQQQSNNQVRLANVSGTLFEGSASTLEVNGFRVNNVSWSVNPWALFLLRGNVNINGGAIRNAEQIYLKGYASISLFSPNEFSLKDTQIFIPAKSVLSQFRLPVAVTATGRFRVDVEELDMTPTCTNLQGKGGWLNAQVDTPNQPVNLGSFEADLSCDNGNLNVAVLPDNSLQLSANIDVDPTGKYSINGQFRPDAELPSVIQQAADSFFAKNPQGFYMIRL